MVPRVIGSCDLCRSSFFRAEPSEGATVFWPLNVDVLCAGLCCSGRKNILGKNPFLDIRALDTRTDNPGNYLRQKSERSLYSPGQTRQRLLKHDLVMGFFRKGLENSPSCTRRRRQEIFMR